MTPHRAWLVPLRLRLGSSWELAVTCDGICWELVRLGRGQVPVGRVDQADGARCKRHAGTPPGTWGVGRLMGG
jgi:hypothetical protein